MHKVKCYLSNTFHFLHFAEISFSFKNVTQERNVTFGLTYNLIFSRIELYTIESFTHLFLDFEINFRIHYATLGHTTKCVDLNHAKPAMFLIFQAKCWADKGKSIKFLIVFLIFNEIAESYELKDFFSV